MNPKPSELVQAEHEYEEANLAAEAAERTARRLRKAANNKLQSYERLVLEHNGQLILPITSVSSN